MKTIIKKLAGLSFLLLLGTVKIYAATHTVTNSNDAGAGSLRQTIQNANSGDSIVFATNVNYIMLTSGEIRINKNLTICDGSDTSRKVTISGNNNSRIFFIGSNLTVNMNNLILTKGYGGNATNGGAVYVGKNNTITATNCNFIENSTGGPGGGRGGAIFVDINTDFTAINCVFSNNSSNWGGAIYSRATFTAINCIFNNNSTRIFNNNSASSSGGGAISNEYIFVATDCTFYQNSSVFGGGAVVTYFIFVATNCTFYQNSSVHSGGAVSVNGLSDGVWSYGTFVATNCTFYQNSANNNGSAISISASSRAYLYHCTFDDNQAATRGNRQFSYNCIFTGNTPNQILDTVSAGNNLIEGRDGVTRDLVFGNNTFNSTVGYITPLPFAISAARLTPNNIQVPTEATYRGSQMPTGITIADILAKLTTDQIGTMRPTTGYVTYGAIEITEIIPPPICTLTVNTTTGGTTNPKGVNIVDSGEVVFIEAFAEECYEFVNWTNTDGAVISTENPLSVTMLKDTTLQANFKYICDDTNNTKYTIRASKHPLTDPTRRNYRVPVFIKADEYISNKIIDSLVIEIDRRIFYPKRVDNGDMSLHFKDTVIKMTFENVTVPELKANEEKVLLTIRGDVLLGEIDNSEIKIDTVKFAEQLSEKPDLIHGFITLDICVEGANRLVWFDYSPEVIVKNNPVIGSILELQCKTIERGSYSLEIVDMLGKSETVREFTVNVNGKRIFDFEIPISNFSSGAYFIIMNTPTAKYSVGFVVQ